MGGVKDELGTLVKKLSSLSLRCSGSSNLTLASSMSLLMAPMRASVGTQKETCREVRCGYKLNNEYKNKVGKSGGSRGNG